MKLTHPHVRHLYWSITSQTLAYVAGTHAFSIEQSQGFDAWFIALDEQPQPLEHFIAEREHRLLGSYFEVLWQFFLTHFPDWSLLGSRIQVPPTGPTQGELDIVAQSPSGDPLHIELAVKFYLRPTQRSGTAEADWLGPQTRDRLDLKLSKLADKQFPFFRDPAAQATLAQADLPLSALPTSVIKGYLFEPGQTGPNSQVAGALPDSVNPQVHMGYWYHHNRIQPLLDHHDHWAIIDKWQWLGPYQHHTKPLDAQQVATFVEQHFQRPNYALMLVQLAPEDEHPGAAVWIELQRFMLVEAGWPHLNPA